MNYTADQLKAWAASAADIRGDDCDTAQQLRAHAAALEENAKLKSALLKARDALDCFQKDRPICSVDGCTNFALDWDGPSVCRQHDPGR